VYDRRVIVNAMLHIIRAGCPLRMMLTDLSPWRIVSYYFVQRKNDGTFDRLNDLRRVDVRAAKAQQVHFGENSSYGKPSADPSQPIGPASRQMQHSKGC
jgi:transposase